MKEKSLSKQGMLSSLSSMYYPLGLAALFMPEGKKIIQSLCNQNLDCDEQGRHEGRHTFGRYQS